MKIDNAKKEIARFLTAGAIVNAADFSIYYILFHFLPFSLAKGISFTCAGIVGYLLVKFWTFKHNQPSSYSEVGRYALINSLALGINVLVNQSILNAWPGAVWLALIIATALTGLFTFACFKWWVFRILLKEGFHYVWWKWLPLRFVVRAVARRQGFLDPIKIISQMQNFAQPSEVAAPMELLRSGVVMHARGLINSLAIQHNLDWIWPYWVECQYNPANDAFIPRSFSLTQINLTHRNWTALGIPDCTEFPLVDPRGLVTPYYNSWSIDFWIVPEEGEPLIPSRLPAGQAGSPSVSQKIVMNDNLCVITEFQFAQLKLQLAVQVIGSVGVPVCQVKITGSAGVKARLVVSLRPYNPEGVSFINDITLSQDSPGWQVNPAPRAKAWGFTRSGVNRENYVYFDKPPDKYVFSDYQRGDVYSRLLSDENEKGISCKVGMASSAALYLLEAGKAQEITISLPLTKNKTEKESCLGDQETAQSAWKKSLRGACLLQIPDEHFKFLYEAAIHTMILHSPKEVYPGPYIYRRFWFRDAAFILHALLSAGLKDRVRRALDCFGARQTAQGYFLSQEGEWDSNGEALWIMRQYCEMTGNVPPEEWKESINKAGMWIYKKLSSGNLQSVHAGLLPAGFSAEHLGPNDFYYWDDFWAVAGLKAAAFLCAAFKDDDQAFLFESKSQELLESINQSLKKIEFRLKRLAMPASPYRRLDSGAIGSLVAGYPLRVFQQDDPRILDTANFLMKKCLVHGGFFHDMTHSGINPYLTLHLAQVLLRAGDSRYFSLMAAVAKLASSTGQWPESIHPRTGGGCMGDGQHVWAAAEWVLMIRNCFVREEENRLILCSGIPRIWLEKNQTIAFGPAPTSFGDIQISIKPRGENILIEWRGVWFAKEPPIDIQLPGFMNVRIPPATNSLELKFEVDK
ncbi:MAG: GtrA family protein [Candidatus Omnitrophica bacterium]|nr:GtrA family protein [Candidatus Omnitrophota bacterium]